MNLKMLNSFNNYLFRSYSVPNADLTPIYEHHIKQQNSCPQGGYILVGSQINIYIYEKYVIFKYINHIFCYINYTCHT